ncbi:hypothetical protein DFQ29_006394, partial [Apophysomyces sp. BC1021]
MEVQHSEEIISDDVDMLEVDEGNEYMETERLHDTLNAQWSDGMSDDQEGLCLTLLNYSNNEEEEDIDRDEESDQESEDGLMVNLGEALALAESSPAPKGRRGAYRQYNDDQLAQLLHLVTACGVTAAAAGRQVGIKERTAQNYVKMYYANQKESHEKEKALKRGPKPKLTAAHSQHMIKYVDENPTSILEDVKKDLCDAFEGLTISTAAVHKHLVGKCRITLKK